MGEILIVNKQNEKNFAVDLYVRSWIEIISRRTPGIRFHVDLYVRSWIEIYTNLLMIDTIWSTSMWGRELKYEMMDPRTQRLIFFI